MVRFIMIQWLTVVSEQAIMISCQPSPVAERKSRSSAWKRIISLNRCIPDDDPPVGMSGSCCVCGSRSHLLVEFSQRPEQKKVQEFICFSPASLPPHKWRKWWQWRRRPMAELGRTSRRWKAGFGFLPPSTTASPPGGLGRGGRMKRISCCPAGKIYGVKHIFTRLEGHGVQKTC